ncbi:MAG TPA: lipopolysaccharide biosynthesis protein [Xenococcaceae cyanobacterium]|jgi:PST family polysaccharide transporter
MIANKFKLGKLKKIFSGSYVRNVGWLGGAELFNRVFRLGTTVTLARLFTTEDYGLMAFIYTTFEIASVFTLKHGISAKIIQTDEKHLITIANTCYWLNWLLCISLFILQCLAAFPITYFYQNDQLLLPLCVSALVYLVLPLFTVNSALIERENRLKVTAMCHAGQSLINNLIIVVLALLGMGIWSIVLGLILSMPVWIYFTWKNHSWRPPTKFTLAKWQEIVGFGKNILGVEILNKLRMNIDYLLVGKFLGVEALGIYFFAFNAGSGIITNVVYAFLSALFPHLCAVRENKTKLKKQFYQSFKTIAVTIVPLVILQSSLSPFYVPIIFGEKWVMAVPILIMVCLSVIPRTFSWATVMLLNSINKPHLNLYLDLIFTVIFTAAILMALPWGIYWVAASVLLSHVLILPAFTIWSIRQAFK